MWVFWLVGFRLYFGWLVALGIFLFGAFCWLVGLGLVLWCWFYGVVVFLGGAGRQVSLCVFLFHFVLISLNVLAEPPSVAACQAGRDNGASSMGG